MTDKTDAPLHWEQIGQQGRPMVLLPPNPMDFSTWLYQMAHLSTWFKTIAIDLPGYGHSPAWPSLEMQALAEATWKTVDAVTEEPAILVGNSVGSELILFMAAQRPERTLALIISGFGLDPAKSFAPKRIADYQRVGFPYRREHILNVFGSEFRKTELAQFIATIAEERNDWTSIDNIVKVFRMCAEPDPDWLFEAIKAPTLIITGSEDPAHQGAFRLQQRIRGCELVTMEGAGHLCHLERPWEFDRLTLDFLAKLGLVDGTGPNVGASG